MVITKGVAICEYEPREDSGLEGYVLNEKYKFEHVEAITNNYYRLYIKDNYYETCSARAFNIYFNIILEPELFIIDRADPFIYIDVRDKGVIQIMDHKYGIRIQIFKLNFKVEDNCIQEYFIPKSETI